MKDESARIATFKEPFPLQETFPLTPDKLASVGFYSSPIPSAPDRCVCFGCGLTLTSWARSDDPMLQHLRWSSGHCPHVAQLLANASDVFGASLTPRLREVMASLQRLEQPQDKACRVPQDFSNINSAALSGGYRSRTQILLTGEQRMIPFEFRVEAWQELEVRPERRTEVVRVQGHWWLLPGSSGHLRSIYCALPSLAQRDTQTLSSAARSSAIGRGCMAIWGGPWTLEACSVLTTGGQGIICSHAGQLHLRTSEVGGLGNGGTGLASSALFVVEQATVVAFNATLRHCALYAARAYHEAEASTLNPQP